MYREVKDSPTMFPLLTDLKDYTLFKTLENLTIQKLTKNFCSQKIVIIKVVVASQLVNLHCFHANLLG